MSEEGRASGSEGAQTEGGGTRGSQPSVRVTTEIIPFAYRLIVYAIVSILVAFLVVVATYAALGILSGANAPYFMAALIAFIAVVGSLVWTYFGVARRSIVTREIEISDETLKSATEKLTGDNIPEHGQDYLLDYFKGLTQVIHNRAERIASEQGRGMETRDLAQACTEIAPGNPFPKEEGIVQRITSSITGITVISAVLAIIFGGIAYFSLKAGTTGGVGTDTIKAFIDIAQIVAGAVVGSTGAAVVSGR